MENARGNDVSESSETRMNRMEQMLTALTEVVMQQQRQQHLPPPYPPAQIELDNNDIINLTQKFMKIKPPTFLGGIEPLKAKTWLLEMEKLLEVFPCSEIQKVLLATYTLKDEARRWWLLVRNGNENMTWELKQGRMSVAEYEAKFTELARFAPLMVDTDYKKARKFESRLDLDILDRGINGGSYFGSKEQTPVPRTDWMGKSSGNSLKNGCSFAGNKRQNTGSYSGSSQSSGTTPTCPECGRKHKGVYYRASGACFRCGKTNHVMKDCPIRLENVNRPAASSAGSASTSKMNMKANTGKETLRQSRVFALVPGDVKNTESVVLGTISICA
ncbi:uncharacterized protein LOC114281889 [Camellia sinensis]|uniref:uncharacterized protein LOC114281889 n=1 Tax=Camellia sinensis TaxID=4442 RepID=UPI0010361126|nr:uncharacterized protein LOC114281889 [Camellia sinensis]